MMKPFNIVYLLLFFTGFSAKVEAQKKFISYQQAFENHSTGIFKSLPVFKSWQSQTSFLMTSTQDDRSERTFLVDIRKKTISPVDLPVTSSPSQRIKGIPEFIQEYSISPDSMYAAYTFQHNLYIVHLPSEEITQLTYDGNDSILNGYSDWMYYEEILDTYKAFWWSPDSRHLVFMRFDESAVPIYLIRESKGAYGSTEKQRYPKAGGPNPKVKIGLVALPQKKITWASFPEGDDVYFRRPYFTPQNEVWVQRVNRRQDTLSIFEINYINGNRKEIFTEHQETWVTQNDGIFFLPDKNLFINRSDKSGWSHYYLHDRSGRELHPITSGNYSVGYIVKYDPKTNRIFFTARKENSTRVDLYCTGLDGKNMTRISKETFSYGNFIISPGTDFFIASYSNTTTPVSLAVFDLKGTRIMELGSLKGAAFSDYFLPTKELKRTKSEDGLFDLPFIVTYPANFDPSKKYPVLFQVYGGPYSTSVYDSWTMSLPEIWWAQEGIIQVTADNRGSGHFGKEGMKHIYKKTGIQDIEDFMAIGRWFKQQPWTDTTKICLTGFSHGGYLTCLGLTYGSDVFNYGIAWWPLTDWRLYDTYYTERYMGMPQTDSLAYQRTSVLHYAKNYRGLLRIVHGNSDNNVHVQHSLLLADTLQNLNKKFELMIYPGQRHGLTGAKWKHNKMETYRFYYENLLNKKLPEEFRK